MKAAVERVLIILFPAGIFVFASTANLIAQNAINVMVLDHNRRPVANIDVELPDDLESFIAPRKTLGSGLYSFQGHNRGIYYIGVRIEPVAKETLSESIVERGALQVFK